MPRVSLGILAACRVTEQRRRWDLFAHFEARCRLLRFPPFEARAVCSLPFSLRHVHPNEVSASAAYWMLLTLTHHSLMRSLRDSTSCMTETSSAIIGGYTVAQYKFALVSG